MIEDEVNRRRSQRYRVALPVWLKDAQGGEHTQTANVSSHGIAVRSARARPLRQYVELELTLPAPSPSIRVTAVVSRHADTLDPGEDGPGLGLDFFLFDAPAKSAWLAFLERLREEGVSGIATPADPEPRLDSAPEGTPTFIIKPRDLGRLWFFFRGEMTRGRVRIEAPVAKPVGATVEILVVHPTSRSEWSLAGRVSRVTPHARGSQAVLEIDLVGLTPALTNEFRAFIATGRGMIEEDVPIESDSGFGFDRPDAPRDAPPGEIASGLIDAPELDEPPPGEEPTFTSEPSLETPADEPRTPLETHPSAGNVFASFFEEAARSRAPEMAGIPVVRGEPLEEPERRAGVARPDPEREIAGARAQVARSPHSVTACYRLSLLLMKHGLHGSIEEAKGSLERVLALEPSHPGAHHKIAELHARGGDYRRAHDHLLEARRLGYRVDPDLERIVHEGRKGV